MGNVPVVSVEVAVAVGPGGSVDVCPYCQYHIQANQRYVEWRNAHMERGYAISIVRAHVPLPESLIDADSVAPIDEEE